MQRRARLRAQDGQPLLPPPGLEQLISGSSIPDYKLQEAQAIWTGTRQQLATQPADIAAAERLLFLTMALKNALTKAPDDGRIRAMLESALEVVTLPRHRQTLRCDLARRAATNNDLQGAEEWLTGCDPYSEDLTMDSAYRITRAFIDTGHSRPQSVLQILGGSFEEVAIQDALDPLATVLRANAWERMGQLDGAHQVLAQFMSRHSGMSSVIPMIVSAMPQHWYVCAQSLASARQEVRQHVGARAASGGGGLIIGIIVAACGGGIPLVVLAGSLMAGEFHASMLTMLIFPVVFGGMGVKMIRRSLRMKAIATGGIHGQGTILGCRGTGTHINNVPVMEFQVQVQVEGHPPVSCTDRRTMHSGEAQSLVGRQVGVIWHPKYPAEVVLEI
jgi:hypothetical protein